MTAIQNKIYATLALLSALFFTSCAEIDLCEEDHSALPAVNFSYNWGENANDAPGKMYAIAHRIINDWQRAAIVSASERSDTFNILPGEYKFLTLPTQHDAFNMDDIIECINNPEFSGRVQDKSLSYKLFSTNQQTASDESSNTNNYSQNYILTDAKPFYFDSVSVVNVYKGIANIQFSPKPITQSIDVEFLVLPRTDNKIDSIYADLSGIPVSIELGSKYVSEKTASAILPLSASWTKYDSSEDGSSQDVLKCSARINVPTVLNSQNENDTDGPGILTVAVFTTEETPEGNIVHCTIQKRNLHNVILNAKLYVYADDNEHILRNGEHGAIAVKTPFVIYK